MSNSQPADAIQQSMELLRRELDQDVQEITNGVRDMRDWRSYVKSYPWVCMGAAVAAGYLVVPRRLVASQPDSRTLAELAKQSQLLVTASSPPKVGLRGVLLAIAGNLLLRRALSYVEQRTEKFFAQRTAEFPSPTEPQLSVGTPQDDRHDESHI